LSHGLDGFQTIHVVGVTQGLVTLGASV